MTEPRKILFLVSSMNAGGAERVVANLTNALTEHGNSVTVMITFSGRGECFYTLSDKVELRYLADEIGTVGRGLWTYWRRFRALRHLMSTERPDVVVSFLTNVNLAALVSTCFVDVPVIACERVYPPKLPLGFLWEHLRQWSYPHASRVVMQTNKGLQWLNETIPKARGVVIPNPVLFPLPDSKPRIEHSALIPPDRKLLLAVGRLDVQKGFDSLINAFALLSSELENWDLIILGEGAMRQALEAQVKALCLESRVYLPGRVGNVGEWYKRAELYVMSSRFEGFPNTLMEAMTHGCAVVSYDCDTGPRDIIRHEVDGLLVSPVGDVPALAKCLGRLMGDDTDRQSMAQRAIEVRGRFSAERVLALWDRLFEEVVG